MTAFQVIAVAGLVCGVLDISATGTLVKLRGGTFEGLLHRVASGALGPSALTGGKRTASIGLLVHFLIALSAAAVYYGLSREVGFLLDHAVLGGLLYGAAVHLFMSLIVMPLSAVPKRPFSRGTFVTQLLIHLLFVGLPISLVVVNLSG